MKGVLGKKRVANAGRRLKHGLHEGVRGISINVSISSEGKSEMGLRLVGSYSIQLALGAFWPSL